MIFQRSVGIAAHLLIFQRIVGIAARTLLFQRNVGIAAHLFIFQRIVGIVAHLLIFQRIVGIVARSPFDIFRAVSSLQLIFWYFTVLSALQLASWYFNVLPALLWKCSQVLLTMPEKYGAIAKWIYIYINDSLLVFQMVMHNTVLGHYYRNVNLTALVFVLVYWATWK